jgi:hypothetical protein
MITCIPKLVDRGNKYNYQDREQFYQKLNPYLDKLSKIVAIFVQSAPLIAKKQQDKDIFTNEFYCQPSLYTNKTCNNKIYSGMT